MARNGHHVEPRLGALRLAHVSVSGNVALKFKFARSAEPHILLFRRPIGTDPKTGEVNEELRRQHFEKGNEMKKRFFELLPKDLGVQSAT